MEGVQIENVNKIKYLGIWMNHRGTFEVQNKFMWKSGNVALNSIR